MNGNVTGTGEVEAAEGQNFFLNLQPRHENKSCSVCPEDQLEPF